MASFSESLIISDKKIDMLGDTVVKNLTEIGVSKRKHSVNVDITDIIKSVPQHRAITYRDK